MGASFTIPAPRDYLLKRDYCSYGYFLLTPNHWEPATGSVVRTLELEGGAVTLCFTQPKRGEPIRATSDRRLLRSEAAVAKGAISRMLRLDEDHAHIAAFHKTDPR